MCGIIFAKRDDKKSIIKSLIKRYNHQSSRGMQGFGFLAIEDGCVKCLFKCKTEREVISELKKGQYSEVLFHHRLPTSTENLEDCNHPIMVENKILDKVYYVIHNGVLSNEDDLKTKHEKLGFEYTTLVQNIEITRTRSKEWQTIKEKFNDSESLAIDLALFLEGKIDKMESRGSIAFICVQADKKGKVEKLYYGRNKGNPIVLEDEGDMFFLKSTGSGKDVAPDILYSVDYPSGKVSEEKVDIGYYPYYTEYNRYTPYDMIGSSKKPWEKDDLEKNDPVVTKLFGGNDKKEEIIIYGDDRWETSREEEDAVTSSLYEELETVQEDIRVSDGIIRQLIEELNVGSDVDETLTYYQDERKSLARRKKQIEEEIMKIEFEKDSKYI